MSLAFMNTDLLPEGNGLWEGNARLVKEDKKKKEVCGGDSE